MPTFLMELHGLIFALEPTPGDQTLKNIFLLHFVPPLINLNFNKTLYEEFLIKNKRFQSTMRTSVHKQRHVMLADHFVTLVATDGLTTQVHADYAVVLVWV